MDYKSKKALILFISMAVVDVIILFFCQFSHETKNFLDNFE